MDLIPPLPDVMGWAASALTLLAFSCNNIVRLRYTALAANAAFITYGLTAELWPVLVLHFILVPVNLWRLLQTRQQVAQARDAAFAETAPVPAASAPRPPPAAAAPDNRIDNRLEGEREALARGQPRLWMSCVAFALVAGLALATSFATLFGPAHATAAAPAVKAGTTAPRQAPAEVVDTPLAVNLHQFALNALLAPLMDDSVPGRWTDLGLDFMCDPGTRVLINGEPMVPASLVPAVAFTVRWDMDHCEPLGLMAQLSGGVDLLVFHEDAGMSAIVIPDRLQVNGPGGRSQLRGAFTADLALFATASDP